MMMIVGCATTIDRYQSKHKLGDPAKVVETDTGKIYYWYFYKGGNQITLEVTTDKNDKVQKEKKYWTGK
jgi:hypothetical protein